MYIQSIYIITKKVTRVITNISKWGNSHAVRLPKELLEQAKITANDKVLISFNGREITMRKVEETKSARLARRFEGFQGDTKCTEDSFGPDVGKEVVE